MFVIPMLFKMIAISGNFKFLNKHRMYLGHCRILLIIAGLIPIIVLTWGIHNIVLKFPNLFEKVFGAKVTIDDTYNLCNTSMDIYLMFYMSYLYMLTLYPKLRCWSFLFSINLAMTTMGTIIILFLWFLNVDVVYLLGILMGTPIVQLLMATDFWLVKLLSELRKRKFEMIP